MIQIDGAEEGRRLKIVFEQMTERIIEESEKELEIAVTKMENDAKAFSPVDTGRLRNSIGKRKVSFAEWEVGTNVEYAREVEFGTMRKRPKPYLRPAFDKNIESLKSGLRNAIKRGMS